MKKAKRKVILAKLLSGKKAWGPNLLKDFTLKVHWNVLVNRWIFNVKIDQFINIKCIFL